MAGDFHNARYSDIYGWTYGDNRIETLQPYILCANGRHTFVWMPHAPHGSFDYAAPAGLRCQCGAVEYKPVNKQPPHTGQPAAEVTE